MDKEGDAQMWAHLGRLDKPSRLMGFPTHLFSYHPGRVWAATAGIVCSGVLDASCNAAVSGQLDKVVENPVFWATSGTLAIATAGSVLALCRAGKGFYSRFYRNFFELKPLQ